jgi:hypothetical protein
MHVDNQYENECEYNCNRCDAKANQNVRPLPGFPCIMRESWRGDSI